MTCHCESSHCTHHDARGDSSYAEVPRDCPNVADGQFTMTYVGNVCAACAESARSTGGAQYITEAA